MASEASTTMSDRRTSPTFTSARNILEGTMSVLNQANLTREVIHPVTLRFRDERVEEVFLNEHARAHKKIVYVGIFLKLFCGTLMIFLCHVIGQKLYDQGCMNLNDAVISIFCQKLLSLRDFGPEVIPTLEASNSSIARDILREIDSGDIVVNRGSVKMRNFLGQLTQLSNIAWALGSALLMTLAHWRIHWRKDGPKDKLRDGLPALNRIGSRFSGSRRRIGGPGKSRGCACGSWHRYLQRTMDEVENKKWATISICISYTVTLTGYCLIAYGVSGIDIFWEMRLLLWYTFTLLLATWFTGILFWYAVIMMGISTAAFYGTSVPILFENRSQIEGKLDTLKEIEPVFETTMYCAVTIMQIMFTLLMLISTYWNEMSARKSFLQSFMIKYQQDKMLYEKERRGSMQGQMLDKILPPKIVEQLISNTKSVSSRSIDSRVLRSLSSTHESVCILFADVVGFSSFAKQVDAVIVMQYLNRLFEVFDSLCDDFNVYKIETIGDCYVATVGLVTGRTVQGDNSALERSSITPASASKSAASSRKSGSVVSFEHPSELEVTSAGQVNTRDMVKFAVAMVRHSKTVAQDAKLTYSGSGSDWASGRLRRLGSELSPTSLRVGVHTGSCVSGIIGTRNLRYCILGESVSIAAKLEQSGRPDMIHASATVREMAPKFHWKRAQSSSPSRRGRGGGEAEKKTYLLDETGLKASGESAGR